MDTPSSWNEECFTREQVNEGVRNTVYNDSMGIPTIGIGFNLQRDDAVHAMALIGANLQEVLNGRSLSNEQVEKLFAYAWSPIVGQARASLQESHFDCMSDARRFVLCDLVYNMGEDGWDDFHHTRALIDAACHNLRVGNPTEAHRFFGAAADALSGSDWASQVGDRAKRDIAMLRSSGWVSPTGDGSDG